jgi:hypothetical protein
VGTWAILATLVTAVLAATLIGVRYERSPSTGSPANNPTATASIGPAASSGDPTPAAPVEILIPAIAVRAPVTAVGLTPDGRIEAPPLDRPEVTGWYIHSPRPGEPGPAVIVGHVDTRSGPAVFSRLAAMKPGDRIEIIRGDGKTVTFTVDSVERFAKDTFPTERVYGDLDYPGLRLITCGGTFDRARRSYRDNVVVFARVRD